MYRIMLAVITSDLDPTVTDVLSFSSQYGFGHAPAKKNVIHALQQSESIRS